MPSPHVALAALGFLLALGVTLVAASLFADRLDRVGVRLGFTEALLGVLTAIAADSPELASSVAAILRGERDVGLGVVLGSNAFNLAAMVGVGAIIAGTVRPRRSSLAIESIVALALLGTAAALLVGGLPPIAALVAVVVVLAPYITILVLGDLRIHLLPLPASVHGVLRDALGGGFSHPLPQPHAGSWWKPIALVAVALVAIVAGATVMVDTSLVVADAIGLSHALVGLLVLAVVTSLPNMSTAIRLARQGRGDATVSETLNSNNINLVGGIVIPAAILGLGTGARRCHLRSDLARRAHHWHVRRPRHARRDGACRRRRPRRRVRRVRDLPRPLVGHSDRVAEEPHERRRCLVPTRKLLRKARRRDRLLVELNDGDKALALEVADQRVVGVVAGRCPLSASPSPSSMPFTARVHASGLRTIASRIWPSVVVSGRQIPAAAKTLRGSRWR